MEASGRFGTEENNAKLLNNCRYVLIFWSVQAFNLRVASTYWLEIMPMFQWMSAWLYLMTQFWRHCWTSDSFRSYPYFMKICCKLMTQFWRERHCQTWTSINAVTLRSGRTTPWCGICTPSHSETRSCNLGYWTVDSVGVFLLRQYHHITRSYTGTPALLDIG